MGLIKNILGIGGTLLLLLLVIGKCSRGSGNDSADPPAFGWNQALTLCQMTIKQLARDPETAEVPYVERFGSGDEFYFAWGASTKMVRMTNGLGLKVPVSASCIVDGKRRAITSLTLDGKTII